MLVRHFSHFRFHSHFQSIRFVKLFAATKEKYLEAAAGNKNMIWTDYKWKIPQTLN